MSETRFYYIDETNKKIVHYGEEPEKAPEGFAFCGSSRMAVKAAAGFYARKQEGFTIINGDPSNESETQNDQGHPLPTD